MSWKVIISIVGAIAGFFLGGGVGGALIGLLGGLFGGIGLNELTKKNENDPGLLDREENQPGALINRIKGGEPESAQEIAAKKEKDAEGKIFGVKTDTLETTAAAGLGALAVGGGKVWNLFAKTLNIPVNAVYRTVTNTLNLTPRDVGPIPTMTTNGSRWYHRFLPRFATNPDAWGESFGATASDQKMAEAAKKAFTAVEESGKPASGKNLTAMERALTNGSTRNILGAETVEKIKAAVTEAGGKIPAKLMAAPAPAVVPATPPAPAVVPAPAPTTGATLTGTGTSTGTITPPTTSSTNPNAPAIPAEPITTSSGAPAPRPVGPVTVNATGIAPAPTGGSVPAPVNAAPPPAAEPTPPARSAATPATAPGATRMAVSPLMAIFAVNGARNEFNKGNTTGGLIYGTAATVATVDTAAVLASRFAPQLVSQGLGRTLAGAGGKAFIPLAALIGAYEVYEAPEGKKLAATGNATLTFLTAGIAGQSGYAIADSIEHQGVGGTALDIGAGLVDTFTNVVTIGHGTELGGASWENIRNASLPGQLGATMAELVIVKEQILESFEPGVKNSLRRDGQPPNMMAYNHLHIISVECFNNKFAELQNADLAMTARIDKMNKHLDDLGKKEKAAMQEELLEARNDPERLKAMLDINGAKLTDQDIEAYRKLISPDKGANEPPEVQQRIASMKHRIELISSLRVDVLYKAIEDNLDRRDVMSDPSINISVEEVEAFRADKKRVALAEAHSRDPEVLAKQCYDKAALMYKQKEKAASDRSTWLKINDWTPWGAAWNGASKLIAGDMPMTVQDSQIKACQVALVELNTYYKPDLQKWQKSEAERKARESLPKTPLPIDPHAITQKAAPAKTGDMLQDATNAVQNMSAQVTPTDTTASNSSLPNKAAPPAKPGPGNSGAASGV